MANLGMADTLILMVLALVVFGPRRLPQIGRQIGKLMYEFRKASNDFKFQMEEELRNAEEADRRKKEEEERQRALAAAPPPPQLEQTTSPSLGVQRRRTGIGSTRSRRSRSPVSQTPIKRLVSRPATDESPPLRDPNLAAEDTAGRSRLRQPAAAPAEAPTVPPRRAAHSAALHRRDRCGRAAWHATPATGTFRRRPGKIPESVNSEAVTSGPEAERSEPAAHHG